MVAGLTKAFLGVGDNQKELSFSDHTHNLPDLDGILTVDKGGTGVSSLGALKSLLGVSSSHCYVASVDNDGYSTLPNLDWVLYIGAGSNIVVIGYRIGYAEEDYKERQIKLSGDGSNKSWFNEAGSWSYDRTRIYTDRQLYNAVVFYK